MMYALISAPNEPVALGFLLLVTGLLLNLGYSSFTVYPAGLTTKETYPLAVSVVNTGGQAGGAVFPFLTGLILNSFSWNAVFAFLSATSLVTLINHAVRRGPSRRGTGACTCDSKLSQCNAATVLFVAAHRVCHRP